MAKENLIINLTFNFSVQIIELYKYLIQHNEFVISKQLLRSSTTVGANVEEANAAMSKKEFIQRMAISSKEARETKYWLRLLDKSQIVTYDYSKYLTAIDNIINIITRIVKTSQESIK
jgi:four helix bundle protein